MEIQDSVSVFDSTGVTRDEQLLVYGKIQGTIAAKTVFRDLVNTNYVNEPTKGGTVKVDRLVKATSQAYGTARSSGSGDDLQNNYATISVDVLREIAEEMRASDTKLWREQGAEAVLRARASDYATSMGVELEKAYFEKLQLTAQANGLVDLSGETDLQDQLTLLIETLEETVNDNVEGVDRSMMVLTLAPAHFDALEKVLTTMQNPITGRTDERYFRQVAVRSALRQGYDAIIQVVGSLAQPVVMDDFRIDKPQLSNDYYSYISYYYGTGAVMPDLVLAGAIDDDISA
jgi:post-segregation antitoxin (ccd killing protein)